MSDRLLVASSESCIGCYRCVLGWSREKKGLFSVTDVPVRIQRDGAKYLITVDEALGAEGEFFAKFCNRGCFQFTHAE